ncbi:unnamed protein product [Arabidopsis arenosa]|uniref:Uncharacterized protein n=1 Tax=Arabidopsis arenosa TaxID=38785 RepID=A0A8S2A6I9_ARAAE|nr:unnamed protein product [Arabidopsis arenosa]
MIIVLLPLITSEQSFELVVPLGLRKDASSSWTPECSEPVNRRETQAKVERREVAAVDSELLRSSPERFENGRSMKWRHLQELRRLPTRSGTEALKDRNPVS